jgi:hypothetical protein
VHAKLSKIEYHHSIYGVSMCMISDSYITQALNEPPMVVRAYDLLEQGTVVKSLAECLSFLKTVGPSKNHIGDLPEQKPAWTAL